MSDKIPRILIVDDDEDIRLNLADILKDVGFETETAGDGKSALQIVDEVDPNRKCRFDLCLLDFKMPGMDGVELLQQIHTRHPKLRTIMITAYTGDDGTMRAMSEGTWRILQKPVDMKLLLGIIDEAIAT